VALSESVQLAHALNPTNDSERLLYRHFLDNLIRLDCQGRVRPSVAESWSGDGNGRIWTLTLREGTRFPGGMPIDPLQVASLLTTREGRAAGIDSAVALNRRQVRIYLHEAENTGPTILAEPALALQEGLASIDEPLDRFDIPPRDGRPFIRFEVAPNRDPRDAIDRGVGLAVTRDPSILEYVANRPEYITYPLPWSLTYVLLQPAGTQPIERALETEAVHAVARPAEGPFWWDSLAKCVPQSVENQEATSSRVVYPAGDEVARGLAERIVALSGDSRLSAVPLSSGELATALRQEAERAYVFPVPRRTLSPCREAAGWPASSTIRPLIDTRATAVVRRGSPPLGVDWDGTVRVSGDSESSGSP
jgi:hypothetical protein